MALMALIIATAANATTYTETFAGLNSMTAKDGVHAFDIGEWTFKGMSYGSSALKFNTNGAYIISPKMDNITKLSFTYRAGGSNKVMTVSYSTDGTKWEDIDQFTIPSSSSNFSTWSKSVALGDKTDVQFRILAASSNCYIKTFTASDDAQSGGNEDYTDDPDYKTDGVWVPQRRSPRQGRHCISVRRATTTRATARRQSRGITSRRHTKTPKRARTSSAAAANTTSTGMARMAN